MQRLTKKSVVLSSDFVVANQRRDRLPLNGRLLKRLVFIDLCLSVSHSFGLGSITSTSTGYCLPSKNKILAGVTAKVNRKQILERLRNDGPYDYGKSAHFHIPLVPFDISFVCPTQFT